MDKSKLSEEQLVRIRKEVAAGATVTKACREHRIIEPTWSASRREYANTEMSQLHRLKDVEAELARLMRTYVDLACEYLGWCLTSL
jgi:putative transposase